MLTGILLKLGMGEQLAKILSPVIIAIAAAAALLWLRADAYGDGKRDENARWEAAIEAVNARAKESADQADDAADGREDDFTQRVREERERIDDAIEQGGDPFDVLFPAG